MAEVTLGYINVDFINIPNNKRSYLNPEPMT